MVSEHASPLADLGGVDAGGQNVYVENVAREFGRRGHEVTVYTRRDDPDLPVRVRLDDGVTVEHVAAGPATPIAKDDIYRFLGAFTAWLHRSWQADPPDVIHAHHWMSGAAAMEAADGRIPLVQSFHALGAVKRRHQGAADTSPTERIEVERRIARRADLLIATCIDEQRELHDLGAPPRRVTIVPGGIDTARFHPDGPKAPRSPRRRVLMLGRLVPRKGVDVTIQALRRVPGAELVVAGGPPGGSVHRDPEVARLRSVAVQHMVEDRVRFIGPIGHDDVPWLLRSADVVACTPWYEPFGIVPLEAMGCGVPVVASAVGGMLDTVQHGRTGLHVGARDPEEVGAALRFLLRDEGRRRRMGAAAAFHVRERYAWPRIVEQLEERYLEVVGQDVLQEIAR